jgi:hypothetical protein
MELARLQAWTLKPAVPRPNDLRGLAEQGSAKHEIPGLAAKHPGDEDIAGDPSVVFAEDFEESSMDALFKRWEDIYARDCMSFSSDVPAGGKGTRSLLLTHEGGKGTGGHLYRRLVPGYDKLYFRFYVKFESDCAPIHHFLHIGGRYPVTAYPQPRAGLRPRSDEAFSIGIEPFGNSWTWDYYTYWSEMRGSPPKGQTWGNSFIHDKSLGVERQQWTCVETMIKMNAPGLHDGELALWINGRKVSELRNGFPKGKWIYDKFRPGEGGESIRWNDQQGGPERFKVTEQGEPFEGFLWRANEQLKINYLWLLLYITDAPPGHMSRVWLDHVVVATQYIGPLSELK